jgi:hypothetical protein
MFKPGQLVMRMIDEDTRFVRRIVEVQSDKYLVSDPLFTCWGSTFARWSRPKPITKQYMEKMFTPMQDVQMITRYLDIKRGQSTSVLFD